MICHGINESVECRRRWGINKWQCSSQQVNLTSTAECRLQHCTMVFACTHTLIIYVNYKMTTNVRSFQLVTSPSTLHATYTHATISIKASEAGA